MNIESEKFSFCDIQWIYRKSREITENPSSPVRTGVQSATVACKECCHVWAARQHGEGKLLGTLGGVIVTCPSCGSEEHVKGRTFEEKA